MLRCYDNDVLRYDYEFVTYNNKTVEIYINKSNKRKLRKVNLNVRDKIPCKKIVTNLQNLKTAVELTVW